MLRVCQIEDAEEEKSSVHLKDVMKAGDGETSLGFGSEETATFSASVNVSYLPLLNGPGVGMGFVVDCCNSHGKLIGWKMVRTVLRCIVYDSCAQ